MRTKFEDENKQKVCGIDIDGVLNYYPECWVDFVNKQLGKKFSDLFQVKLHLVFQQYIDLKKLYRDCGVKANLPVREGSRELLGYLKDKGFKIILLTARDFVSQVDMMKQTTDWLLKNSLPYDNIISGKDKHVKVAAMFPFLKFQIEDNRYIANRIAQWGYKVFLISNGYNAGELQENVIRVDTLHEIVEKIERKEDAK